MEEIQEVQHEASLMASLTYKNNKARPAFFEMKALRTSAFQQRGGLGLALPEAKQRQVRRRQRMCLGETKKEVSSGESSRHNETCAASAKLVALDETRVEVLSGVTITPSSRTNKL
jgi:hypothetical protein